MLIDGDVEIYDSTQIFEYLEDQYPLPALWPREPGMRAAARRLELASDEVFFANVIKLMRSANSTPELPEGGPSQYRRILPADGRSLDRRASSSPGQSSATRISHSTWHSCLPHSSARRWLTIRRGWLNGSRA